MINLAEFFVHALRSANAPHSSMTEFLFIANVLFIWLTVILHDRPSSIYFTIGSCLFLAWTRAAQNHVLFYSPHLGG